MSTGTPNPAVLSPAPGAVVETGSAGTWKPSAVQGISLIVRREIGTYFRSRSGYVIAALILLLDGLLFNGFAIGSGARFSTDVLSDFFYFSSGVTMVAAPLISMRLIAEERQSGSLPLLTTSSLSDGEIVVAKFLSGFLFLAILLLVTIYMPMLIFVRGKVSIGHIVAGYTGLLSLGAACTAIGTFGSAIAGSQVVAVVISGATIVFMLQHNLLSKLVEGTLGDILSYADLFVKHFRPFMSGTISIRDVLFYLTVCAFFLVLARNSLEGRRWKP
jgi:ABC-2 type transport system permease protein